MVENKLITKITIYTQQTKNHELFVSVFASKSVLSSNSTRALSGGNKYAEPSVLLTFTIKKICMT